MFLTTNKIRDGSGRQYSGRIQANQRSTVYHIFSGVPADLNASATAII